MKAAVLYQPGDIRIEKRVIPQPKDDEILIQIKSCGVCGTDYALNQGAYPAIYPVIIGHEFSGEVFAVGRNVTKFKCGDRVTADPNRVCHKCYYCQSGNEHLCENLKSMGVHIDGAIAEYCVMTETNVYKIPNSLSYDEAAFCEPLACAIHGNDIANVKTGDTVVVIGAGGMGNLIAQCAKLSGAANIIVSEPIEKRRELALINGATYTIDPFKKDLEEEVKRVQSVGADVVFEVAGNNKMQADSILLARKGGTVVLFGCSPQDKVIEVNPFIINENELKIYGSYNNQFATARAVKLLGRGIIKVDNLISHYFKLEDYLDVFKVFGGPETIKLMVSIS
ncbi:MAG: zinc-dependent alcohol dehydrogenase family protein [Candidatus Humimicrobiaceae bacterium]